jgi:hypothetical protein
MQILRTFVPQLVAALILVFLGHPYIAAVFASIHFSTGGRKQ